MKPSSDNELWRYVIAPTIVTVVLLMLLLKLAVWMLG
jgi:hypothetical protein